MAGDAIDIGQYHEVLANYLDLITNTWNFFITVHFSLIGMIFLARGGSITIPMRLLLVLPYAAFMGVNYQAQCDYYLFSNALREMLIQADPHSLPTRAIIAQSGDTGAIWITDYLQWIYGAGFVFGCLLIVLPHFFQGEAADTETLYPDTF